MQLIKLSYYLLFTGSIHSGAGLNKVNKFISTINIPTINSQLYKTHERIIGPIIENVAKESCLEAAFLEREATLHDADELKKYL